jgi:hypothetical protein
MTGKRWQQPGKLSQQPAREDDIGTALTFVLYSEEDSRFLVFAAKLYKCFSLD